jgi:hypothetical protein
LGGSISAVDGEADVADFFVGGVDFGVLLFAPVKPDFGGKICV